MSKKAAPKESKKTKRPELANQSTEPWIEELRTLTINDDLWKCNVCFIADTNSCNKFYSSSFSNVFISGKNVRPYIKVISNSSLSVETLNDSHNSEAKKDLTASAYLLLCKEALKYFDTDEFTKEIPTKILASLIKYRLYKLKSKDIADTQRLEAFERKKQAVKEESLLQLKNTISGTPSSKKDKNKATPKSRGKAATDKFTKLKKRGEPAEPVDQNFVHDKTPHGPQLYVILTSFIHADLPLELLKLEIPLIAVVKLHDFLIEGSNCTLEKKDNLRLCRVLDKIVLRAIVKQRKFDSIADEMSLYDLSLKQFWTDLLQILSDRNNISVFKNTMFFKFYPYCDLNIINKLHNSGIDEESYAHAFGAKLQDSIYQQYCFLQYDLQDLKRQHENYIGHLVIQDLVAKNSFSFDDMHYYFSIVDAFPSEIMNIPFILNAIILQVEHSMEHTDDSKGTSFVESEKNVVTKKYKEKENMFDSFLKILDEMYDLLSNHEISAVKPAQDSIIFIQGDQVSLNTYWWDKEKIVKKTTCHILECYWDKYFSRYLRLYDQMFNSYTRDDDSDLFDLLKSTGDLNIYDKLCNLPCHHNNITFEDKAYVFCTDTPDEAEDDKSSSYKFQSKFSKISCKKKEEGYLKHYSDPSKGQYMGQIFDNHSYCFEEMTSDVFLQNLFNSFESFNCLDLLQDHFRDKLFLKFHDRKTCIHNEYLIGTLRTPIALKDFYDYTVDEEFYWLNEQELLYTKFLMEKEKDDLAYDLKQLHRTESKFFQQIARVCSEKNFILPDSFKFQNKSEVQRFSIASTASRDDKVYDEETHTVNEYLEAYDIDLPYRVQFSERRQEIVFSTNSKLLIKKLSRLYLTDAVFLQITVHDHTLYFFRPVNKISDNHFHLIHESGMIFYLRKNSEDTIHRSGEYKFDKTFKEKEHAEFASMNSQTIFYMVKYNLSLSLPNSLYLQTVNNCNNPFYIKQYHLSKIDFPLDIKNERFRCYLLDGKLMKFMDDGSVVIYYPNSEIYNCKRILFGPLSSGEDIPSSISASVEKEQMSGDIRSENKIKEKNSVRKLSTNKKFDGKNEDSLHSDKKFSKTDAEKVITIIDSYELTLSNGRKISVDGDERIETEPLFCKSYTDIQNGINITERSDGTKLTHNYEGTLIVDFSDGTRITTFATFSKDEIIIEPSEDIDQVEEDDINDEDESKHDDNSSSSQINSKGNSYSVLEGFVLIEVSYVIEHPNFATISVNTSENILDIRLPLNVCISLTSKGFYSLNFDQKAELTLSDDELIFSEINKLNLPQFILYLQNCFYQTEKKGNVKTGNSEIFRSIFCGIDSLGHMIQVDEFGDVHLEENDSIETVCKCSAVDKNRYFIMNNNFSGLEIFHRDLLDKWDKEAKNCKNSVIYNYSSNDHHVLLLLKPMLINEHGKWLKDFDEIKYFPRFLKPSTYNIEGSIKSTMFNPFPKAVSKYYVEDPKALLISMINRVNCNIHLQRLSFLQNKAEGDLLRVNKLSRSAIELYRKGGTQFLKSDKTFIEFTKNIIIGNIVSRMRKRIIKRLEFKKTKEYEMILKERKLLPYFSSAHGSVHVILLEIINAVVEGFLKESEGSLLEQLLKKPLDCLSDDDLNFMHDKIRQFTVGSVCSCSTSRLACRLRILLLAGRTLHGLIPDMITVFFLYSDNMKKKRAADEEKTKRESNLLKELLKRPLQLLTEDDFKIIHDRLKNLPYCTCSSGSCKLKILLLAGAVLNDFFPNLDCVLKSSTFNVIV